MSPDVTESFAPVKVKKSKTDKNTNEELKDQREEVNVEGSEETFFDKIENMSNRHGGPRREREKVNNLGQVVLGYWKKGYSVHEYEKRPFHPVLLYCLTALLLVLNQMAVMSTIQHCSEMKGNSSSCPCVSLDVCDDDSVSVINIVMRSLVSCVSLVVLSN
ncbi:hypothetical protein M8J77_017431 [Diaphorina citri]|nr:hypothetical protein M8J77_017431 [Diaphorina citri]